MKWLFPSLFVAAFVSGLFIALKPAEVNVPIVASVIDPRTVPGPMAPEVVNLVVQIQQGTQSKYVLDTKSGILSLDDIPYHQLNLPGDYGVIAKTLGRDGKELGVIALTTDPAPAGTLIKVRPIGLILADEGSSTRNIIISVPIADIRFRDVYEISDLQKEDKDSIVSYIKDYKTLKGRPAKVISNEDSKTTKHIIELGISAYNRSIELESK
ncbi:hypothetical protein HN512_05060 [Candidatus Peregrinibacteria bacterium]|jgi:inorganic pyrophosphatase|nr:hypothetical protein [Candidatus Peregrinibacteria bacterium]MBT3599176.1 hypothetical protein [Candidatus Peregrinibacteria bacterium]MBT4366897.1 hypothetical protein [Candidatus Peregrinibacteria bacterium]MBT4585912.1 hypothetical protein [Candidatus Peregrinibacteria bacterium]MBT6730683.1 hypothetical protein [Candidatus Peregrinibacteria bacterium]